MAENHPTSGLALAGLEVSTVVGDVAWGKDANVPPYVAKTSLAGGQWRQVEGGEPARERPHQRGPPRNRLDGYAQSHHLGTERTISTASNRGPIASVLHDFRHLIAASLGGLGTR